MFESDKKYSQNISHKILFVKIKIKTLLKLFMVRIHSNRKKDISLLF